MQGELTGRKVAGIFVAGFGIVIAVNFTMAAYATRGFSGTVVDNSYVASQKFNGWLSEAEAQRALGWQAMPKRQGKSLVLETHALPEGAQIIAHIRRPLGEPDQRQLTFTDDGDGQYRALQELPAGRWIVRIAIEAGEHRWVSEEHVG